MGGRNIHFLLKSWFSNGFCDKPRYVVGTNTLLLMQCTYRSIDTRNCLLGSERVDCSAVMDVKQHERSACRLGNAVRICLLTKGKVGYNGTLSRFYDGGASGPDFNGVDKRYIWTFGQICLSLKSITAEAERGRVWPIELNVCVRILYSRGIVVEYKIYFNTSLFLSCAEPFGYLR